MRKGDLVTVDFPFTDLTGKKKRPALVLATDAADVTLAFITTQLHHMQPADVLLTPNALNGLKLPSAIRVSKIATLSRSLIHGKLGDLTTAKIAAVDAGLVVALAIDVAA